MDPQIEKVTRMAIEAIKSFLVLESATKSQKLSIALSVANYYIGKTSDGRIKLAIATDNTDDYWQIMAERSYLIDIAQHTSPDGTEVIVDILDHQPDDAINL